MQPYHSKPRLLCFLGLLLFVCHSLLADAKSIWGHSTYRALTEEAPPPDITDQATQPASHPEIPAPAAPPALSRPVDKKHATAIHKPTQNADTPRISIRDAAHVKPRNGVYHEYISTEASVQQSRSSTGKGYTKKTPLPQVSLSDHLAQKHFVRPVRIVIDPGHGGKDAGTVGHDKTLEKTVVLAISKDIRQAFSRQHGFRVFLTRKTDVFLPLQQRLHMAKRHRADLFISIHADAAYQHDHVRGATVFALSPHPQRATSDMAMWLAQQENHSELLYNVTLHGQQLFHALLLIFAKKHTIATSLIIGKSLLASLQKVTHLHNKQVEQADFVVLRSPHTPSLLVETGYLSNPKQAANLRNPAFQKQLAAAIVQGIVAYFVMHPPQNRSAHMKNRYSPPKPTKAPPDTG